MGQVISENEGMLKNIVEHSNEVFYIHDTNQVITYVSPQCKRIFGYTQEEMKRKWTSLTTKNPVNEKGFKLTVKAMKTGQRQPPYILEAKRKDGKLIWIEVDEGPLRDRNGKIVGITGALRDVTEQKKVEKKLRESERRFMDIALSSGDFIWEVDNNGKYTLVAGDTKKILGYTPEEINGKTPFNFMSKEEAKRVGDIFRRTVSKKEKITNLENWNITKSGKSICLLTNGVPILDNKGNLTGYRGIDANITESKKMNEELQKLASVVRYTKELVNLSTPDGKMVFLNAAGGKMLGIDPKEVEKHYITEVIPENFKEKVTKEVVANLASGKPWEGELQYLNIKTQKIVDVHAITFPIIDEKTKKIKFFANVSMDIAESKKTEETLKRKNMELEKINRMSVGRELKMVELKKRVRQLEQKLSK